MSIQKLIDDNLQQIQDERKTRVRSGKISPSSLGGCFRKQIYNIRNVAPSNPPDGRTLRVFKAGQLFHDFVQSFLPKESTEVEVETDEIKGFADIVGRDTVYDIKSQHSRGFWYMQKKGYDVKKEKANNWLQLACYGKLLKKPKLCLMMVSKDDLCINEYTEYTRDWEVALDNELKMLGAFIKSDDLPPKEPRLFNGKECSYCNWKTLCKGKDGKRKDIK